MQPSDPSRDNSLTLNSIYDTLKATGYYEVERQPFLTGKTTGTTNLTVDNQKVSPVNIFDYTPSAEVSAPLVIVANLGCDEVCILTINPYSK